MPEMNLSQTGSDDLIGREATQPGNLQVSEAQNETTQPNINAVSTGAQPSSTAQTTDRTGTVEHLAARRTAPPIDASSPTIKQQLSELRIEVTRLLTGVRWNGLSVEDAAQQMVPLLNVGSVQQWQNVLIPFLLEIDRAGNLLPVWLHIIEHVEDPPVPSNANPAETLEGRARRFAILMLGNYKHPRPDVSTEKPSGFSLHTTPKTSVVTATTLTNTLGTLATDPNTSHYAVQSLVKLSTNEAIQALLTALKNAEGWAKVDIIDGILTINQERFYDIVLTSGLDKVPSLESYVAIPLYRKLPLERYLRASSNIDTRLTQQAALAFAQVLQTSSNPPAAGSPSLPVAFERDLPLLTAALFEGARLKPMWQNVAALHRLGFFLGRYWSEVARGTLQDPRIVHPIQACAPMMPEVERWMASSGRDTLLDTLAHTEDDASLAAAAKVLGELREPRTVPALLSYIESVRMLSGRPQALALESICDTLVTLGERQAVGPMQMMVNRLIDTQRRASHPRRRDNLPLGDGDVPGSIIYAAVVRSLGKLGDRNVLSTLQAASRDFDPYVRAQTLTALKQLDPQGEIALSHMISRDLLTDPNDNVARAACQLTGQYRDQEATITLHRLLETRPALSAVASEALRQIEQ
jgi:HEAT repeat protein